MPENTTQIPAARVPIWDTATLYVTREWYRFFYNIYELLGGGSLRYGTFYDTTTQTATVANTAYAITYNTTDLSDGVTIGTPTSRIYVSKPGAYNFQFSLQLYTTNATAKNVYIWARINGVNIPNSATKIYLKGSSSEAYVAAWNFVLRLNANDYFELMWSSDHTGVQLLAETATSPAPAIPSVIMTVTATIGA
jgi:hypothetical protein